LRTLRQASKACNPNSVLSSKFLPASGTNAAFNFTERRHVAVIRALPGAKPDAVTSFATLAAIRRASSWWAAPRIVARNKSYCRGGGGAGKPAVARKRRAAVVATFRRTAGWRAWSDAVSLWRISLAMPGVSWCHLARALIKSYPFAGTSPSMRRSAQLYRGQTRVTSCAEICSSGSVNRTKFAT
jgi:hypothetical protein